MKANPNDVKNVGPKVMSGAPVDAASHDCAHHETPKVDTKALSKTAHEVKDSLKHLEKAHDELKHAKEALKTAHDPKAVHEAKKGVELKHIKHEAAKKKVEADAHAAIKTTKVLHGEAKAAELAHKLAPVHHHTTPMPALHAVENSCVALGGDGLHASLFVCKPLDNGTCPTTFDSKLCTVVPLDLDHVKPL